MSSSDNAVIGHTLSKCLRVIRKPCATTSCLRVHLSLTHLSRSIDTAAHCPGQSKLGNCSQSVLPACTWAHSPTKRLFQSASPKARMMMTMTPHDVRHSDCLHGLNGRNWDENTVMQHGWEAILPQAPATSRGGGKERTCSSIFGGKLGKRAQISLFPRRENNWIPSVASGGVQPEMVGPAGVL